MIAITSFAKYAKPRLILQLGKTITDFKIKMDFTDNTFIKCVRFINKIKQGKICVEDKSAKYLKSCNQRLFLRLFISSRIAMARI